MQNKRGKGSIKSQYYKTKRACGKLRKNAINMINTFHKQLEAEELAQQKKDEPKSLFSKAISALKYYIQSKPLEISDLSSLFVQLVSSYLELGYSKVCITFKSI